MMKTMQEMNSTQPTMMKASRYKRIAVVAGVVAVGTVGWYLFRPELLFVNTRVNESLPAAASTDAMQMSRDSVVATGMFHKVAHDTKGSATIHRLDGKTILRLTDFATSNGPDVHVYLTSANDASDNETVTKAGFVDLGSLKGNLGDQNYELPADVDASKYHAVAIWCKRFGVNFGTAPLAMN